MQHFVLSRGMLKLSWSLGIRLSRTVTGNFIGKMSDEERIEQQNLKILLTQVCIEVGMAKGIHNNITF